MTTTTAPPPTRSRLLRTLLGVGLILPLLALLLIFATFITRPVNSNTVAGAERILGYVLPESADEVQSLRYQTLLNGYSGYTRFAIAPEHLSSIVERDAVAESQTRESPSPLMLRTLDFDEPPTRAPEWWQPASQGDFLLLHHDFGDGNPDAIWYIIDRSDPSRYTVFAFAENQ